MVVKLGRIRIPDPWPYTDLQHYSQGPTRICNPIPKARPRSANLLRRPYPALQPYSTGPTRIRNPTHQALPGSATLLTRPY